MSEQHSDRYGSVKELEVGEFRCAVCGAVSSPHDQDGMTECAACVEADQGADRG